MYSEIAALDVDWVFGYGSLIWDPEVDFEQAHLARLHGYHRAFCIHSTRYRGTADEPGVVLGLDRGGSCVGIAYRLRDETRDESIRLLCEREIPVWEDRVYQPVVADVRIPGPRTVRALTFAAERGRPSYERLDDDEILRRLCGCRGLRGANRDYAINTWQALEAHGVHDARLARLIDRLLAREQPAARGARNVKHAHTAPQAQATRTTQDGAAEGEAPAASESRITGEATAAQATPRTTASLQ